MRILELILAMVGIVFISVGTAFNNIGLKVLFAGMGGFLIGWSSQ